MTGESPDQAGEPPRQGLLDTNVLVLRRWVDPTELPDEMALSAITLAELSAGPHQVRPNGEQDMYDEHEERARRTEALQRAAGRKPRTRIADLIPHPQPSKLVTRVRFPSSAPIFFCSMIFFDIFSDLSCRMTAPSCHGVAWAHASLPDFFRGDSRSWVSSSDGTLCVARGPHAELHLFQLRCREE